MLFSHVSPVGFFPNLGVPGRFQTKFLDLCSPSVLQDLINWHAHAQALLYIYHGNYSTRTRTATDLFRYAGKPANGDILMHPLPTHHSLAISRASVCVYSSTHIIYLLKKHHALAHSLVVSKAG